MAPRACTTRLPRPSTRAATDFFLTSVGCFGACCQEPLVNVHVPGHPLLILHQVQASDAGRIVHDVIGGNITPDLVYCKVEEWDHITGFDSLWPRLSGGSGVG